MININTKIQTSKNKQNNPNPSFKMNYEIIRLPNVSDSFVKTIEKSLITLPDKWGGLLRKSHYKLYCADSIASAFEREDLSPSGAPDWDAVTCDHPWIKFFVFTPKIKPQDAQKVVNHEICHGIVDIENIMENPDLNIAITKDASTHIDCQPKGEGLWDVKPLLRRHLDDYGKNEIFADTLAWSQPGGGLWGSGYKNGLKNPNFLKENFPTVYEKIRSYEVRTIKESDYLSDDEIPF